jgi:hypothetical protein
VSWSVATLAQTYELQESWQDGEWYVAYSGSATSAAMGSRPPGSYAYRCRAANAHGQSEWSETRRVTVAGDPPRTITTPSSSRVSADGQAVLKVVNDSPYALRVDLTGPSPQALELPACSSCRVYSFIGPFFCPTSGRPIEEFRLDPGPYRVFVTASSTGVRPYVGHWQLRGDRRYTVCFSVVRSWSSADDLAVIGCAE